MKTGNRLAAILIYLLLISTTFGAAYFLTHLLLKMPLWITLLVAVAVIIAFTIPIVILLIYAIRRHG